MVEEWTKVRDGIFCLGCLTLRENVKHFIAFVILMERFIMYYIY